MVTGHLGTEPPTIPFQITFKGFEISNAVWLAIQKRIARLEHYYDRLIECDVVVSSPHKHQHKGEIYHVQIHLRLPGKDIIISRNPEKHLAHKDIYVAIRDSFDALDRKLEDHVRIMRNKIKNKNLPPRGKIVRLFPQEGYGFIQASDGQEVYFDAHSVVDGNFADLTVGQKIRYSEEMGENGPQASTVHFPTGT